LIIFLQITPENWHQIPILGSFPLEYALPMALSVFVGLTLAFTLYYANKEKRDALRKLSDFMQGGVYRSLFMPSFKGEYQGLKFSIALLPAGRNTPPYLDITFANSSSFTLSISRESIFGFLGKNLGVIREVEINDKIFDDDFLIRSNKRDEASAYLSSANVKNAIIELFSMGFTRFKITGKNILIHKPNYILERDLNPQNIISILQKLAILAKGW